MNCPKCGYERQTRDNAFVPPGECPACGVVYAKHESTDAPAETVQSMPAPNLRPSPVDALSLRKARERVEKRLREQQGKRVQDDRHARTLELAKQLASEELRKRQEEWKQTHADEEESATEEADGKSPIPVAEAAYDTDDERASDHPSQGVDSAADEMMTAANAMEETADASVTVVEDPPESAGDENAAEALDSEEESAAGEADGESPTPVAEAAFDTDDKRASDHPSQGVDSAADEMMTAADAMEETEDAPVTVVEDPPESAGDENAAEALGSRERPESTQPDDVVEAVPPEAAGPAAGKEPLPPAAFLSPNPESEIPESATGMPAAHVAAAALSRASKSGSGTGLTRLLPVVAWLILGAGIIGAVLSWTTITDVEAGARVPIAESMNSLPLGLLLGFAYLATGVLGFAFFWVSSLISTQLRDIQRMLLHPPEGDENV